MANIEHLSRLRKDKNAWNLWRNEYTPAWRGDHPETWPDLTGADLSRMNLDDIDLSYSYLDGANFANSYLNGATLRGSSVVGADFTSAIMTRSILNSADLSRANFYGTNAVKSDFIETRLSASNCEGIGLSWSDLSKADLSGANLSQADLRGANLSQTNLTEASLATAELTEANLSGAKLCGARFRGANLTGASLVRTSLSGVDISRCRVFGVSAWKVDLTGATQTDLIITPEGEPDIQVDQLEIAQFVYLLLNNAKIRDVVETITSKMVLILGRFSEERIRILETLRNRLRELDYVPVLFDFQKPRSRSVTETVSTLAHLSKFIIADLTDAKSIPQELSFIIPQLKSVPVQPILLESQREYGMYEHFLGYPWVLPIVRYRGEAQLIDSLKQTVLEPAELKWTELHKIQQRS